LRGAAVAGSVGSGALRFSTWVDRMISGRRGWLVVPVSAFVVVAPWFDEAMGERWAAPTSLFFFLLMLVVLALARLDAFRDETGAWRIELVERAVAEMGGTVGEEWGRFSAAPAAQRAIDVGKLLARAGLLFAAFANVIELFDREAAAYIRWPAFIALFCGLTTSWWGRVRLRGRGRASGVMVADDRAAFAVHEAIRGLPPVLDCSDKVSVEREASRASHPLVRRVLQELAGWRPRASYDDEREFHDKIFALFKRQIPEAAPLSEEWIRSEQEQGRVDILLTDGKSPIEHGTLVEIKARPTAVAMDRLIGQAWKYLRIWRQRGPLILVLCRTDPHFTARLREDVLVMRQHGFAVLAILAAP
jgi:hypothetical protein